MSEWPYLVWVLPLIVRGLLVTVFFSLMCDVLPEAQNDRETHRSIFLAFVQLSFAGLLALTVVDAQLAGSYRLPVFYLLVSFLAYLVVLNLQSYKTLRWHDQCGDALAEVGSLSLVAAVVSIILKPDVPPQTGEPIVVAGYRVWLAVIAVVVWCLDAGIRIRLDARYLYECENAVKPEGLPERC